MLVLSSQHSPNTDTPLILEGRIVNDRAKLIDKFEDNLNFWPKNVINPNTNPTIENNKVTQR